MHKFKIIIFAAAWLMTAHVSPAPAKEKAAARPLSAVTAGFPIAAVNFLTRAVGGRLDGRYQ